MRACVAMSYSVAITVNLSESNYVIGENDGRAELMLILSYPSSTDITVRVDIIDVEAIGECNCDTHIEIAVQDRNRSRYLKML